MLWLPGPRMLQKSLCRAIFLSLIQEDDMKNIIYYWDFMQIATLNSTGGIQDTPSSIVAGITLLVPCGGRGGERCTAPGCHRGGSSPLLKLGSKFR